MNTKQTLIFLAIILTVGFGGGMFTGYEIWKGKEVEYIPDPEVPRLQAENVLLKDSVDHLKDDIKKGDSSYAAKSNQYIITKYKYEKLRKDVAGLNSAGSIDMLNRLFPER